MNAIIGLCHFCEAHGPRPLFCTFTTHEEAPTKEASVSPAQCSGCTSVGPDTVYVSRDRNVIYCSRESVPNSEVTAFLRQAAIRSITCEVSWNKLGGIVYFSDTRGHVLSCTFQVKDTRARGLKRWFSIVVLMKDKMLLLNITPMLAEHMQRISKELQDYADKVFEEEQKICSQRALRLNTGRNDFGPSRSLSQLTGQEFVFKKLHAHFAWLLKAGAMRYVENLHTSQQVLYKINPTLLNGTIFSASACDIDISDDCITLRKLEELLSNTVFKVLLYCFLIGIKITIKPNCKNSNDIIKGLRRLCPISNGDMNISVTDDPICTNSSCILEQTLNQFCLRWKETVPEKYPMLMNRILSAMSNSTLDDAVLHQYIKSLVLEWLGIANTIKAALRTSMKQDAVNKLKMSLGVTKHDDILLNYWMATFCN